MVSVSDSLWFPPTIESPHSYQFRVAEMDLNKQNKPVCIYLYFSLMWCDQMTVVSSQTVCVIMERTDLCAVVRCIHPISDLFSRLSSSSSSGENVILCNFFFFLKGKEWRLEELQAFVQYQSQNLFMATNRHSEKMENQTAQTSKWGGSSVQPQLEWKWLPGPSLNHFDGQPVSGLGPFPRAVLLLWGLLKLTVSIHRERPRRVDVSIIISSFFTVTHVRCYRCEPTINEVTPPDVDDVCNVHVVIWDCSSAKYSVKELTRHIRTYCKELICFSNKQS